MDATKANNTGLRCYPGGGAVLSSGIWLKDSPLEHTIPNVTLQITLFSIVERFLAIILQPFGQPSIVPQLLSGMILGPSVLGRSFKFSSKIYSSKSYLIIDPFARFGLIFINFLMGVRMDLSIMFKSGRISLAIGVLGFLFPMVVGAIVTMLLSSMTLIDAELSQQLGFVIMIQSMTTSPVITNFLREVKILNSELGRIATSSSLISDLFSFSILTVIMTVSSMIQGHTKTVMGTFTSVTLLLLFVVFIVRPAAMWVNRRTPQGHPVKEVYVFATLVILLVASLAGEIIGLGSALGALSVSFFIPDGPPFGATLDNKISTLNTVLFMPMFFTYIGLKTDMTTIKKFQDVWIVEVIIVTILLAKTTVIMLIPLYYKMPFRDALTLALVMNSKGVIEATVYEYFLGNKMLASGTFSIVMVNSVILAMLVSYLVKKLYDPSTRYLPYRRRTIQHIGQNAELGVLVCIHDRENVPAIIKILEASNPTKESPIHVCFLHLVKLVGRSASVLINHSQGRPSRNSNLSSSESILKAFRYYEKKNQHHFVTVDGLTSISPADTMHDDVCSLALDNRSVLIIMPFHKQWLTRGYADSSTHIRTLNYNVLAKAPCSVGILVDRRYICPFQSMRTNMCEIGILFIGGADDREALSYGARMVKQPNIQLTVIRFISKDVAFNYSKMKIIDNEVLENFKTENFHNDRVIHKVEEVSDGQGLVKAIRTIENENTYDLMMVGKRHIDSPLMAGLTEWTEYPELGVIGDILATSDVQGVSSVMVVQQQARLLANR